MHVWLAVATMWGGRAVAHAERLQLSGDRAAVRAAGLLGFRSNLSAFCRTYQHGRLETAPAVSCWI